MKRWLAIVSLALSLALPARASSPAALVRWPAVRDAAGYVLEIAKDPGFAAVLVRETPSEPQFAWRGAVPGVYHFRVAVVDREGTTSGFSNASLLRVVPEAPRLQEAESVKGTLVLTWSAVPHAKSYRVVLGADPSLSRLAYEKTVAEPRLALGKELPDGRYHWSVRAVTGDGLESMAPAPRLAVKEPEQVTPELGEAFRWKSVAGAKSYRLEVASDPGFRTVVHREDLRETAARPPLPGGTYHWRVGVLDAPRAAPRWSATARAVIAATLPPPPQLLAPPRGATIEAQESFSWQALPQARLYEVEAGPVRQRVREPKATLRLPPGAHTWRVRASSDEKRWSHWSEARPIASRVATPPVTVKASPEPLRVETGRPWLAIGAFSGNVSGSLHSTSGEIETEVAGELARTSGVRVTSGPERRWGLDVAASRSQWELREEMLTTIHAALRVQWPLAFGSARVAPFVGPALHTSERLHVPQTADGWVDVERASAQSFGGILGLSSSLGSRVLTDLQASIGSGRTTLDASAHARLLYGLALGGFATLHSHEHVLEKDGRRTTTVEQSVTSGLMLSWLLLQR